MDSLPSRRRSIDSVGGVGHTVTAPARRFVGSNQNRR